MRLELIVTSNAGVQKTLDFQSFGELMTYIMPLVEEEAVEMPVSKEEFENLPEAEQDKMITEAETVNNLQGGSEKPGIMKRIFG